MRPESLLNEISAISPIMTSQSTYKKVDDERKIPKCVGGFQRPMRSSPNDLGNILSSTPGLTADEGMRFEDEVLN